MAPLFVPALFEHGAAVGERALVEWTLELINCCYLCLERGKNTQKTNNIQGMPLAAVACTDIHMRHQLHVPTHNTSTWFGVSVLHVAHTCRWNCSQPDKYASTTHIPKRWAPNLCVSRWRKTCNGFSMISKQRTSSTNMYVILVRTKIKWARIKILYIVLHIKFCTVWVGCQSWFATYVQLRQQINAKESFLTGHPANFSWTLSTLKSRSNTRICMGHR